MSMILLAVEDAVRDAPVRDLLTAEGWWVTTVVSQEEALRAAADHAPQLLIVDAGLAAVDPGLVGPGGLLRAFGRQEGGPGVLVLVDREGDAAPADGDGVIRRDQKPAEILAVVRRSLHAPRSAAEPAAAAAELTSEHEQLTTLDLFGDILQKLDGDVAHPLGEAAPEPEPELVVEPEPEVEDPGAELVVEPEAEVEEPEPELAVEPEAEVEEPEPELVVEPEAEVEEPEPELAVEPEAEVEEPEPELVVEPEAEVEEPEPELVVEPEAEVEEPEPELVVEPEAEVEEPEPESKSEVEPEPEVEEAEPELAVELEPEIEEPEPEVESDEMALEPEILAEAATASSGAEDPDWLIDQVLDGDSLAAESAEEGSVEPSSTVPPPEFTTDIEAEVDGLLAVEDASWRDSIPETDQIEGPSIDEALAGDGPATDGADVDATEAEDLEDDDDLERLGPYKLFEMLEYGDLTERWLAARADGSRHKVVVERIRHELQARADVRQAFVDGYSEAAGWDQENILKVVDLGRDGDADYVATEYHPGHSLREVLHRIRRMEARMPLGIGLLLAERIAAGLQGLGAGSTSGRHGWLVPSSIWLTDEGEVLLREFGFGRLEPVEDVSPLDWTEYRFVGPDFWSGRADLRADLYSLGALVYETIGGRPAHEADDRETLIEKIRQDSIAPAQVVDPTIPSEVDGWIMRLLRRNPGERPQAVEEIAAKVDLALQSLSARPSNAELAAYLRQLFAARVPEIFPASPSRQAAEAAAVPEVVQDEPPQRTFAGHPWTWWLLIAILVLVAAFFAWRLAADDEGPPGSSRESELVSALVRSSGVVDRTLE